MPYEELRNAAFEDQLHRAYYKCKNVMQSLSFHPLDSNLSTDERNTLIHLKSKPFIFLPADKGGEFCIIEQFRYSQLAVQHISDISSYTRISHLTTNTIEKRIIHVGRK